MMRIRSLSITQSRKQKSKVVSVLIGLASAIVLVTGVLQAAAATSPPTVVLKATGADAVAAIGKGFPASAPVDVKFSAGLARGDSIVTSGADGRFGAIQLLNPGYSGLVSVVATSGLVTARTQITIGGGSTVTTPSGSAGGKNEVSINDDKFVYSNGWHAATGSGKFNNDDHWTTIAGSTATLEFTGTNVALYGSKVFDHGYAAIAIDGQTMSSTVDYETTATRQDGVLMWKSATLSPGAHKLVVSSTGKHDAASNGDGLSVDRAVINDVAATSSVPTTTTPTSIVTTPITTKPISPVTPPTTTKPTSTVTTPTTSKPTPAVGAAAGSFLSGGSRNSVGSYRGTPVQSFSTWDDNQSACTSESTFNSKSEWAGNDIPMVVAIGGLYGKSWGQAASGGMNGVWTQCLNAIKASWGNRTQSNIYISLFHEANGNWYPWQVGNGDVANFKAAFHQFRILQQQILPQAHLQFTMNANNTGGHSYSLSALLPNPSDYDVVGVDYYAMHWKAGIKFDQYPALAAAAGKPLVVQEFGAKSADNAAGYFKYVHDEFTKYGGTGPGKLLMANLFDSAPYTIESGNSMGPEYKQYFG